MITEEIRTLYQEQDFEPFEITLRSGRTFNVATRDHIWVTPTGTVHLIEEGKHRIFDVRRIDHINHKERLQPGQ